MNKKESKKLYGELCVEYGKSPSVGEFEAFDKYLGKIETGKYETILNIVRTYLDKFTPKPFPSHFDKAIKQYFGPSKIEKKDNFIPKENQLEINRHGMLLVNFVMFQMQATKKAAQSRVKGVKTLLGFKIKKAKDSIDRLYQKGDWKYLSDHLESDYPFKAEINEFAEKEGSK